MSLPTILLTGASGQLGWELRRCLLGLADVVAPDHALLDLARPETIESTVAATKPNAVINAAAWTDVERSEREPALAYSVNATGVSALAEACRRCGAALVHFSTDYVFDGSGNQSWRPGSPTAPLSVYGQSKLAGEVAILRADVPAWILRTSWLYSARGRNFVLTMLRLLQERPVVRVVDDQFGAPTWVRAVAQAVVIALRPGLAARDGLGRHIEAHAGVYHVACRGETSWYQLTLRLRHFLAESGVSDLAAVEPVSSDAYGATVKRPRNSRLDCSGFESRFGTTLATWDHALALCLEDIAEQRRSHTAASPQILSSAGALR